MVSVENADEPGNLARLFGNFLLLAESRLKARIWSLIKTV
jgi:hypothetical protein